MEWTKTIWPLLLPSLWVILALIATAHASLLKRDVRAAIAWIALIWFAPLVGVILYTLLGVNRLRRRATRVRQRRLRLHHARALSAVPAGPSQPNSPGPRPPASLEKLVQLVDNVTFRPLLAGNSVHPLVGGDVAFGEMLRAIDGATRSITLASYIFDDGPVGRLFIEHLVAAQKRGVAVRVLVDDAGGLKSKAQQRLLEQGVPAARFLAVRFPTRLKRIAHFNLRNHRKIMVVDGLIGFTGGMNILSGSQLSTQPAYPVLDVHFRIEGHVVTQLQEVFAEDWHFTVGEKLQGEPWFGKPHTAGDLLCRGIADGPDEDLDSLVWTLQGALSCAQKSVRIVTPYFLPDRSLITALEVAALRGVQIDIIVPEVTNYRVIDWAMRGQLPHVFPATRGSNIRVLLVPPPFDHSKLLVVDNSWSFVGSTNWDPRSLRLNFEFNIECYGASLARDIGDLMDERVKRARPLLAEELAQLPRPIRVRNALARLLIPYL